MLKANVGKFNLELNKLKEVAPEMMEDVIKKISFDALRDLQIRTPKDTVRAAGGWNTTVNSAPSEWKPPEGQDTYQLQTFSGANKIDFKSIVNISNNVEYIKFLEEGHSKVQAPEGFMNQAMAKMKAQLQKLLRVLNKREIK